MGGAKPSVTLTIAGDAGSLDKAAKQADQGLTKIGSAADTAGKQLADAGEKSNKTVAAFGHLGSAVTGTGDALDQVGGSLQAVVDLQQAGANRASALARSLLDVEQAQEDYNQALRDSKQAALDADQAAIDLEQANLDAKVALDEYNAAVKEHGINSAEAMQAQIDLKQANQDAKQAQEDQNQALRDGAQATIDAKSAQLDLNDATREAHPPELSAWADKLTLITPLLSSVVGVTGLVTGAQWAWNSSLLASPITWIIVGIVALVAAIVLIATKTDWFQRAWSWAWSGIRNAAGAVVDWTGGALRWLGDRLNDFGGWFAGLPGRIQGAFWGLVDIITWPFRTAFNFISRAWNSTVGQLSWSVPSWVPGLGGASIRAPWLPTFHSGGKVPGLPGQEILAVLQGGEEVIPRSRVGTSATAVLTFAGNVDSALASAIAYLVRAGHLRLEVDGQPIEVAA